MMSRTTMKFSFCLLFMFSLMLVSSPMALARSGGGEGGNDVPEECKLEKNECNNKKAALRLKVIAIAAILVTSMIGVCLPLFSRSVPALDPERDLFIILKSFSSGIILATGFMHVLPDSFDDLSSKCLPDEPWHKFPFTGFAAMISAIVTLMVDSMATSFYNKGMNDGIKPEGRGVAFTEMGGMAGAGGGNLHVHHAHGMTAAKDDSKESQVRRYKVVAMVLEVGIVVHSVVIGLSLGAGDNTCTIKPLVAALCFHQMFEGMGLGGCILQAEYKKVKKLVMVFFFSTTTPFGIAMGIALSNVYTDNSPASLITEGLLNASSAGLLIYMALVDLLANDFMGSKLQASITLQIKSYAAVLLGAGGMSLMAKWA